MPEITLKNRKVNIDKLISFGFEEQEGHYAYTADLVDGQMTLTVAVSPEGGVRTAVTDTANGEEYVLHLVSGAVGAFVGRVKAEYEAVLEDISARCFDWDVFKSEDAQRLIVHVRDRYGDELEFLWKRFPDNAIWRRQDTGKWYAALLTVAKHKLGLKGTDPIEILDLRIPPEKMEDTVDHKRFFPGYHMNKKHWYTLLLNGSVPFDEICRRVDESYGLAQK